MSRLILAASIALLATLPACVNMDDDEHQKHSFSGTANSGGTNSVNSPISVQAGDQARNVSTVNGSISIGENAEVTTASTVNGGITVGPGATASSLNTVNGGVSIAKGAKVAGDVTTVNGGITLREGAEVAGMVSNVNGHIRLAAAHIAGGIQTTGGDIDVGRDSRVQGGIHVRRSSGPFFFGFGDDQVPRVVIGPGATVEGPMKFERKVELYVSDTAQIGAVEGATPVPFSGDRPAG